MEAQSGIFVSEFSFWKEQEMSFLGFGSAENN